jgi:hypothetical protein
MSCSLPCAVMNKIMNKDVHYTYVRSSVIWGGGELNYFQNGSVLRAKYNHILLLPLKSCIHTENILSRVWSSLIITGVWIGWLDLLITPYTITHSHNNSSAEPFFHGCLGLTLCCWLNSESESELLYDWRFTANQFVLATNPLRLTTSNFILQLNTCGYSPYVTFCLIRGRVCSLQLLLVLASAVILRSESRGTHDHILLSQIVDSPNLEDQVPVFISPRNRVARLYPQALSYLFVVSYHWKGYGGVIRPRLHTGWGKSWKMSIISAGLRARF